MEVLQAKIAELEQFIGQQSYEISVLKSLAQFAGGPSVAHNHLAEQFSLSSKLDQGRYFVAYFDTLF